MSIDRKRLVAWVGDIGEENYKRVLKEIEGHARKSPGKEINLLVTSHGGSAPTAFAFYDLVRASKYNLVTIGAGCVDSAALIVWLAGKKRLLTPHTALLFHEVGRRISSHVSATDLESAHTNVLCYQSFYTDVVRKETGNKFPLKKINCYLKDQKVIDSEEALALGLAHGILKG